MSAYRKKSQIQRFAAGVAHCRHQIVAVLRFEGADFYPLTVRQFLDSRIVGWLDQGRISLPDYSQSKCRLYRSASRLPANEPWYLHLNRFQIWGGPPSSTLIWIKYRRGQVAIVA